MEGRLVLKGCSVLGVEGTLDAGRAILVEDGRITRIAADAELPTRPGDWEVACAGRVVAPGQVDAHAHLAGGLAAPPSTARLLGSAGERCRHEGEQTARLGALELEALTAFAIARAMRAGVTTVVEHLAHDGDLAAALRAQARAAERLGIRWIGAPALRSDDRQVEERVEASAEHVRERAAHPTVRGALGFHASSTADDALLGRLARAREALDAPVHFHLAEDEADLTGTFARLSRRIVPRLRDYGLIGPGTLAALGRALDRGEVAELSRLEALVAISPSFDLTGEPGSGGFEALFTEPRIVALGTAGSATLHEQLAVAMSRLAAVARLGRIVEPDRVAGMALAANPGRVVGRIFGAEAGTVAVGALADLVVYDAVLPAGDPAAPSALSWQRLAAAPVAWCIVAGRVTVREGQLVGADYLELAREAAKVLGRLG